MKVSGGECRTCAQCDLLFHVDCSSDNVGLMAGKHAFDGSKQVADDSSSVPSSAVIDLTGDDNNVNCFQQAMSIESSSKSFEIVKEKVKENPSNEAKVWRCSHCLLFKNELTMGTCWVPLHPITPELGIQNHSYYIIVHKSLNLAIFLHRLEGLIAFMTGSNLLPDNYELDKSDIPKSFYKIKSKKRKIEDKLEASKKDDDSESAVKAAFLDPADFVWHAGEVNAGDVIIFDSHIIHGAGENKTKQFRCSLDFRFILAPSLAQVPSDTNSSEEASYTWTSSRLENDSNDLIIGGRPFRSSNIGQFLSHNASEIASRSIDE